MRIDVETSQHHLEWDELSSRVQFAEDAGFEGVWIFDHFKPLYGNTKGPCMEGWSLLAAIAAMTTRIRFGTLVTGITYRHPSVLAAQAVTIDHVSNGRLELAVGAAWHDQEHHELGIEFPTNRDRIARLKDAVQIFKLLMTQDDVSYDGKHFSLKNATYDPKPVQKPHPPIWIGASGEKVMLPFVAREADVWHTFGGVSDVKRKAAIVDATAEKAGRDPSEITRSTSLSISEDWDDVRKRADAFRDAGFTLLIVSWPSEGRGRLEEFAEKVMPELTAS